jgi:formylmethanofuran dehydrogenase subunit E
MVIPLNEENVPTFKVLDTESSHGRYSREYKQIRFEDMVKFHGHACDGLYRGTYALSVALRMFFPDGIVDRTDLRVVSRNSPCLGDAASYLTGARVRFGTQDVMNEPGVWYILQKISTLEAVYVYEENGFFPEEISKIENSLSQLSRDQLPDRLTELKEKQDSWVRNILLFTMPEEHYFAKKLDYKWVDVPYTNRGVRSDILYKDVI